MRLNFQTHGSGFPVILLHGLFGSLDNWHVIARSLAESWRVLAVDLRNHGHSPHSDAMDYQNMADDIAELMRVQHLPGAHLLGHSLGGKVAMSVALHHPELVTKLIVSDIAPKAYPPVHLPILAALRALDLATFQSRAEIDHAFAPAIPNKIVRQFLLKNVTRHDTGPFTWKMNLRAIDANYLTLTRALESNHPFPGPALFIRGGKSDHIQPADEPLIKKLFPQAEFEAIPQAGHWVHADAPEDFHKAVSAFLQPPPQTAP